MPKKKKKDGKLILYPVPARYYHATRSILGKEIVSGKIYQVPRISFIFLKHKGFTHDKHI